MDDWSERSDTWEPRNARPVKLPTIPSVQHYTEVLTLNAVTWIHLPDGEVYDHCNN